MTKDCKVEVLNKLLQILHIVVVRNEVIPIGPEFAITLEGFCGCTDIEIVLFSNIDP